MNIIDKAASGAIRCYKKRISPLKSWRCAYGVTHGISCSTVADNLIKEHGVMNARPLIKQQFQECRAEYERLEEEKTEKTENDNKKPNNCNNCDLNSCTVPHMPCCFPSHRSGGSSCDLDIGSCDL